jgi:hypothetical protein
MAPLSFAERVLKLEEQMTSLQELPKKVDELGLQIVQLRDEIRSECSAVRAEIRAGDEDVKQALRGEIEETRRQMRVLHEDIIDRLALLDEGRESGKRRRKKP